MKVVLFCGGLGMRMREYSDQIPKPLVPVGNRPILWHIMKYYASYGHKDFILCLGYKGEEIKRFFLDYDECMTNDFIMEPGAASHIRLLGTDIHDWRITFVDTGLHTNIGGRLRCVRDHLAGEPMFLANYSDTLTNVDLDEQVHRFVQKADAVASFLCVRPPYSFHLVSLNGDHQVTAIQDIRTAGAWMNGGYFALRAEIFDYLEPGDELVVEGFERLCRSQRLYAHMHEGFWSCMDTFKEKQELDRLTATGEPPWWPRRAARVADSSKVA
jgi:glucose-1-phosphate cytidylyltransferase